MNTLVAIENCDTGLAARMLALADANELPEDHELRVRARDFDEALRCVYIGRCSMRRFMGIWGRARRAYIEFAQED